MREGYELLESLGPAHPSQVSLTVAEATERELRGIPLAISGDPVPMDDILEREWLRNNPGQPSPFDPDDQTLLAHNHLQGQHAILRCQELRKDWVPAGDTTAEPKFKRAPLNLWPTPSHEALTESITALAGIQRRLMIGGVLRVGAP